MEIVDEEAGAEAEEHFAAAVLAAAAVAVAVFVVDELYATHPCDMLDKFVGAETKTSNS